MNTLEQPLRKAHEDLTVYRPRISRPASRTPRRALKRRWWLLALAFVVPLSGIALLVHLLRSALGDLALPRQEFEGLGIVVCALASMGIFLWGLTCVFERETQQVEYWERPSEIQASVVGTVQPSE